MRLGLFAALLFAATPAQADDWHLDAELVTDVPIGVGARAALGMPHGLRLSTALQVMPEGYVSLINTVVTSLPNTYNDDTATLIEDTLQKSLVWRTHVGWRPWASLGLYLDVGYGFVGLGGATTGEALLAAIVGYEAPTSDTGHEYSVTSALHMIDVEIGYEWLFWDALTLRAALGFAGTLAASTTVEQQFSVKLPAAQKLVDRFEDFGEDYLVEQYTCFVFTPVVSVGVGYRFF